MDLNTSPGTDGFPTEFYEVYKCQVSESFSNGRNQVIFFFMYVGQRM